MDKARPRANAYLREHSPFGNALTEEQSKEYRQILLEEGGFPEVSVQGMLEALEKLDKSNEIARPISSSKKEVTQSQLIGQLSS